MNKKTIITALLSVVAIVGQAQKKVVWENPSAFMGASNSIHPLPLDWRASHPRPIYHHCHLARHQHLGFHRDVPYHSSSRWKFLLPSFTVAKT